MRVVWRDYTECGYCIKEPEGYDNIVTFLTKEVEGEN